MFQRFSFLRVAALAARKHISWHRTAQPLFQRPRTRNGRQVFARRALGGEQACTVGYLARVKRQPNKAKRRTGRRSLARVQAQNGRATHLRPTRPGGCALPRIRPSQCRSTGALSPPSGNWRLLHWSLIATIHNPADVSKSTPAS